MFYTRKRPIEARIIIAFSRYWLRIAAVEKYEEGAFSAWVFVQLVVFERVWQKRWGLTCSNLDMRTAV
ncbi:MAG: hypothetical protein VX278_09815 [Myxococcota bacterium]|nr:hypothetical protein [Myxococcota bacterium]